MLVDVVKLSLELCSYPIGCELKYATDDNFVGRVIDGYDPKAKNVALLTQKVANVICQVQNYLIKKHDVGLFVYDAYRPKRAVLDFIHWVKQPPANDFELVQKAKHYPHIEKSQLFDLDYLGKDSNHCYGNTIDCVLRDLKDNTFLDMGVIFDFFGEESHSNKTSDDLGEKIYHNRQILSGAMDKFDFQIAPTEYWHFTHRTIKETAIPLDIPITVL